MSAHRRAAWPRRLLPWPRRPSYRELCERLAAGEEQFDTLRARYRQSCEENALLRRSLARMRSGRPAEPLEMTADLPPVDRPTEAIERAGPRRRPRA